MFTPSRLSPVCLGRSAGGSYIHCWGCVCMCGIHTTTYFTHTHILSFIQVRVVVVDGGGGWGGFFQNVNDYHVILYGDCCCCSSSSSSFGPRTVKSSSLLLLFFFIILYYRLFIFFFFFGRAAVVFPLIVRPETTPPPPPPPLAPVCLYLASTTHTIVLSLGKTEWSTRSWERGGEFLFYFLAYLLF